MRYLQKAGLFLLVLFCVAAVTSRALGEGGECGDGVVWEYNESTRTMTLSYTGTGSGVMTEYSKQSLMPWYNIRQEVEHLVIGEGVTETSELCFWQMKKLQDVSLPKSLRKLAKKTFNDCASLKEVIIPEGCLDIGTSAFTACESLTSVQLPSGLTDIPDHMFNSCYALESIELPEGILSIGRNAFAGCKALKSIVLPEGVKTIEWQAFYHCDSLMEVILPNSLEYIGGCAFQLCTSLEKVLIPGPDTSLETFGDIFDGDTSLKVLAINGIGDPTYQLMDLDYLRPPRMIPSGSIIYYNQEVLWEEAYTSDRTALAILNDGIFTQVPEPGGVLGIPTREGYTFMGWYTKPDFSGSPVTNYVDGGIYYARWQRVVDPPQTGDEGNPMLWGFLLLLSGGIAVGMGKRHWVNGKTR